MRELGKRQIDSILLEGGGTLNWSALKSGIVQKVYCFTAPKLFGGIDAGTPVEGRGVASPGEAFPLTHLKVTQVGEDLLIEGEVDTDVYRNC